MINEVVHYQLMNGRARAVIVLNTEITKEAVARHGMDPIATIALGRALACVAALASTLKQAHEYVQLIIDGGGPLGKIVVDCNGEGHCRGYTTIKQLKTVISDAENLPGSVGEAVGTDGILVLTRGRAGVREPYKTIAELANGEIATDVARYLLESDQIPSALAAGVHINTEGEVLGSGAVLVQQLGGQLLEEKELDALEARMNKLNISDRIARGETADQIIAYVSGDDDSVELLGRKTLSFECGCSKEKMANALHALGKEELESILRDIGKIEATCPYCGVAHQFQIHELLNH